MRKIIVAIPYVRYDVFEVMAGDEDDAIELAVGEYEPEEGESVKEIGRFPHDELVVRWGLYPDAEQFSTKEITDA